MPLHKFITWYPVKDNQKLNPKEVVDSSETDLPYGALVVQTVWDNTSKAECLEISKGKVEVAEKGREDLRVKGEKS